MYMQLLYFWLIFSACHTSPEILGQGEGLTSVKISCQAVKSNFHFISHHCVLLFSSIFALRAASIQNYSHRSLCCHYRGREATQRLIMCLIVKWITTENFSHKIKILNKVTSVRKQYKVYASSVELHILSTNYNHLFRQRLSTFHFLTGWKTVSNCVLF